MAEGTKSEGQESTPSTDASEPTGEAWLQKLEQIEQEIATEQWKSHGLSTSWGEAVSKDQRTQNHRTSQTPHTSWRQGHTQSRTAKRSHAERLQTQRDIQAQHTPRHWSDVEYTKGETRGFWAWVRRKIGW